MIVGHTHRISNLMRGHILDHRGHQRRDELLGAPADGQGRRRRLGRRRDARRQEPRRRASGPTCRRSSTTPTPRPRCSATRSSARRRSTSCATPTRLHESAMGNMVADAMRAKYPGVDAALHELGRPARRPRLRPAERRRAARRDHLGRDVRGAAVRQPDDDHHAHRRPAEDGVPERLLAGLRPGDHRTGRFPQISGPQGAVPLQRHRRRSSTGSGRRRTASAARSRRSGRPTRSAS